jgi:hypothetical protein
MGILSGMVEGRGSWGRPCINVAEIPIVIDRLEKLKVSLPLDPDFVTRNPGQVLDQIILKLTEARDAQARTYPRSSAQTQSPLS